MTSIIPIPSGRISTIQIQQRILAHVNSTTLDVVKTQNQLATGRRLAVPSDDPSAATRAMSLQRLLEQKEQVKVNLESSRSFLAAADTALSDISQMLIDVRGTALTMVDTTTSDEQRQAASVEIQRTLEQLVHAGNQRFRGRYLFGGSKSDTEPFRSTGPFVVYQGNEADLPSYVDLDLLASTNVSGNEVFGAISPDVKSTVDLNPVLTLATRLDDLRGGQGIDQATIIVSDGNSQSTIDVSSAETVADVVQLIEANPPQGRQLTVRLSASGLSVDIDDAGGGNLTIRDLEGGQTAEQLGILEPAGTGTSPIVGSDLNPLLRLTTNLNEILGVRAAASLQFAANAQLSGFKDSRTEIQLTATAPGVVLEDVSIQFNAVNGLGFGNETATYAPATKTLTIDIDDAVAATAANVAAAITSSTPFTAVEIGGGTIDGTDAADLAVTAVTKLDTVDIVATQPGIDFNGVTVSIATQAAHGPTPTAVFDDLSDTLVITIDDAAKTSLASLATAIDGLPEFDAIARPNGDGSVDGASPSDTSATAITAGGGGVNFDQDSGVQIINAGQTFVLDFAGAETVEDVLNVLNASDAQLLAEINENGTGINVRSRLSGADFHIGENGGTTATELGIRTFDQATLLTRLNYGRGVNTDTGTDFTVSNNGVDLDIDLSSAQTVSDVITLIDAHPFVSARLTLTGNGIELIDTAPGGAALTVTKSSTSNAARDVGLIAADQTQAGPVAAGGSLVGRDTNPLEAPGAINALIRLNEAVINFDIPAIERAVAILDNGIDQLNFARAEIGLRGQAVDRIHRRVEDEEVQVRQTLSIEIDVDFAQAISDLSARQASLQASLQLIGKTFTLTLLDFI